MLKEIDNSEFIAKLRTASVKGLRKMIERDKERGFIKSSRFQSLGNKNIILARS
jgi:hypothetical protein